MIITSAALSDVGRVRTGNEDSYLVDQERGFFVVADGMGGCLAGEVASSMAVELFQEDIASGMPDANVLSGYPSRNAALLARGVSHANMGVHNASRSREEWAGMGTTIAAVLLDGYRLTVAHVGDSRVYLVRGRSLVRLTEDHSYAEDHQHEEAFDFEQGSRRSLRHILTRAVGPLPQVEAELSETDLMRGDRLLLCSDGLTTAVSDEEIHAVVSGGSDPVEICAQLVELANERGGEDNITVVSVFLSDDGYIPRFMRWVRR